MTASTATPGFTSRIASWFSTDRHGRQVAYYWGCGRAIRVGLAKAQEWAAGDLATVLPSHPING
jgi:hypothetical protein